VPLDEIDPRINGAHQEGLSVDAAERGSKPSNPNLAKQVLIFGCNRARGDIV
jgi:hypothetical protein